MREKVLKTLTRVNCVLQENTMKPPAKFPTKLVPSAPMAGINHWQVNSDAIIVRQENSWLTTVLKRTCMTAKRTVLYALLENSLSWKVPVNVKIVQR